MREKMRSVVTSAFEVLGMILVSAGAFQIYAPAGFVVSGAFLIALGALSA